MPRDRYRPRAHRSIFPGLAAALLAFGAGLPATAWAAPTQHVVAARSFIVIDGATGTVMAQRDPDRPAPAASLQKMLTAILVAEHTRPTDEVHISALAAHAEADHVYWPQGATFTVDQLLYGMLLESSNGAAIALAEHVAGSVSAFAVLMDEKAAELGATHSHFVNADGLDAPGQTTTARDLAVIARAVLQDPMLARIVRTPAHAIPWPDGTVVVLHTIDRFLLEYRGAVGVKSGYTTDAGNCLAAAAERGGRVVVAVVMHSTTVTEDAEALIDAAFAHLPALPRAAPVVVHAVSEEPAVANVATAVLPAPSPWSGRLPSVPGAAVVLAVTAFVGTRRLHSRRRGV